MLRVKQMLVQDCVLVYRQVCGGGAQHADATLYSRGGAWRAGKYVEEGGGSKADGIRPVLKLMQLIGALSGNKTVPQVALGYLKAKGAPACISLGH